MASGDPTPEGDYARRQNAHALSLSLFVCMLVPWAFCFLSYTGALFSYPRCVAEHWSLSCGVLRFSIQCAFMPASLGAGIVHWHTYSAPQSLGLRCTVVAGTRQWPTASTSGSRGARREICTRWLQRRPPCGGDRPMSCLQVGGMLMRQCDGHHGHAVPCHDVLLHSWCCRQFCGCVVAEPQRLMSVCAAQSS